MQLSNRKILDFEIVYCICMGGRECAFCDDNECTKCSKQTDIQLPSPIYTIFKQNSLKILHKSEHNFAYF